MTRILDWLFPSRRREREANERFHAVIALRMEWLKAQLEAQEQCP